MDIASIIGLIGGIGMIIGAMISGGGLAPSLMYPLFLLFLGVRHFWCSILHLWQFFWLILAQWQKPLCRQ